MAIPEPTGPTGPSTGTEKIEEGLIIASKQDLIDIANAIREKTNTTNGMSLNDMADMIISIKTESPYNEIENNSNGLTIIIGGEE